MMEQFDQKATVQDLCRWAEVPRSSFHYKAHPGPRGMKPSTHTRIGNGLVENNLVVEQIRSILQMDYCVYGYGVMTRELKSMEYLINKKKVYRLMKETHLLCGRRIKAQGKRQWVSHRRIKAARPLEYLCLDIKYVWIHGENRHYFQLSVIDVFSRRILCWIFQSNILNSPEHKNFYSSYDFVGQFRSVFGSAGAAAGAGTISGYLKGYGRVNYTTQFFGAGTPSAGVEMGGITGNFNTKNLNNGIYTPSTIAGYGGSKGWGAGIASTANWYSFKNYDDWKNFNTENAAISGEQNAWNLSISLKRLGGFSANKTWSITTLVQPTVKK